MSRWALEAIRALKDGDTQRFERAFANNEVANVNDVCREYYAFIPIFDSNLVACTGDSLLDLAHRNNSSPIIRMKIRELGGKAFNLLEREVNEINFQRAKAGIPPAPSHEIASVNFAHIPTSVLDEHKDFPQVRFPNVWGDHGRLTRPLLPSRTIRSMRRKELKAT